jgi:16S rRNA (cytosine967-C5)-methyltransferase
MVVAADAMRIPARAPWQGVLIDAPCSNLGVLRRRVDARWRVQEAEIPVLAAVQAELLEAAARGLEPGGWLVYSVCTVEPEETTERRREFFKRHPDWEPIPGPDYIPEGARREPGEVLLLPGEYQTDGTYAFAVRRPGASSGSRGD